ncbi:hypothetical protein CK203_038292 [Vitis vinifera]|uniref:Leucine-rich repeat-containing N-terminal plant-type domain-containing protein n=1 Tax=Vitis vinifera TaxID=29760 RepID=A0A438HEL0_VITVI|nr:hypothetical protein CK203_038292 [Vitis vinifera]
MFFTSTLQNTTTMMKALKASLFLLALRCLTVASAAWHVDDESGLLAFKSAITHDPSGMLQDWKPARTAANGPDVETSIRLHRIQPAFRPDPPKYRKLGSIQCDEPRGKSVHRANTEFNLPAYWVDSAQLWRNMLTGPIPAGISRLKNLSLLSVDRNQLSAGIPDFFSSFTDLRVLRLLTINFLGKFRKAFQA